MTNNQINQAAAGLVPGARGAELPFASSAMPTVFMEAAQDADEGAVRELLRPGAAPAALQPELQPELSGAGFTYRHNWGGRRGQWVLRLNWSVITPRSRVMVAIGEGAAGGLDAGKLIGSARTTLHNVAPRAGGVDIWVNVEWSGDILLHADYLIVNP